MSYFIGSSRTALARRLGGGIYGTTGNSSGKAYRTASPLSKAIRPNTIKTLVKRKNTASSSSKLPHRRQPNFVPDSIAHVPRPRASSSTIHKYTVGKTIGTTTQAGGSLIKKWPENDHVRSATGQAHIKMRPRYVPWPPFLTSEMPAMTHPIKRTWPAVRIRRDLSEESSLLVRN